ncbi:MAG TPA: hypothetical protein DC084_34940 [Cupriavidus sp.]|nr:hypothetical protein [Cupriavidus sp.]
MGCRASVANNGLRIQIWVCDIDRGQFAASCC